MSVAYWITPSGKVLHAPITHIAAVIDKPEVFGLSRDRIHKWYAEKGEKVGTEGIAREEIIRYLISKGWIRIRRYPNKFWSATVGRLTNKIKDYLYDFATMVLDKAVHGFKENDLYMPFQVFALQGGGSPGPGLTIKDVADFKMYESSDIRPTRSVLVPVESVSDLPLLEMDAAIDEAIRKIREGYSPGALL